MGYKKDFQYYRFCAYGFLKNLRFFEPFLIIILNAEGLSFTKIAALYAIREIVRNIFEIPAGVIADIFGRRRSMIFAFSSYIISFIIFYLAKDFWVFVIAFVLYAIGDTFRTGTHKAMIFTYLLEKSWSQYKVDYYGHTRSWSQIGSALSALGAGILVFVTKEYRLIFILTGIPYLIDLINLASYPAFLEGSKKQIRQENIVVKFKSTISDFINSFKISSIRRTVISLSSYTGYYKAIKDFIQPIIMALALSIPILQNNPQEEKTAILIGVIYFIIYITSSIASRNSGLFVKRFSSGHKALGISVLFGALSGLISGLFVLAGLNIMAVIFFTGIYLVENLRKPVGIGQIAGDLKPEVLASALSAESQAETIFAAIFVFILGFLVDSAGLGIGIIAISITTLIISILSGKLIAPNPDKSIKG